LNPDGLNENIDLIGQPHEAAGIVTASANIRTSRRRGAAVCFFVASNVSPAAGKVSSALREHSG
jgi:hypothetical protein